MAPTRQKSSSANTTSAPAPSRTANMRLLAAAEFTGDSSKWSGNTTAIQSRIVPSCSFKIYMSLVVEPSSSYYSLSANQQPPNATAISYVEMDWPAGGEVLIESVAWQCARPSSDFDGGNPSTWPAIEPPGEPKYHLMTSRKVKIHERGVKSDNWLCVRLRMFAAVPSSVLTRGLQRARLDGGSPRCDAVLCAAGGAELPVHRVVLTAQSPVFAAMLDGGHFKEAIDGRVDIEDVSPNALAQLVHYFYNETVDDGDWAGLELELLQLADKYLLPALMEESRLRLWLADAPHALSLLLRGADGCPLLGRAHRERWIRVVAAGLPGLVETPQWEVLRAEQPLLADVFGQCFAYHFHAAAWHSYC